MKFSATRQLMKYMIYISLFSGAISGLTLPHFSVVTPFVPYLIAFMLLINFIDIKMHYKNLFRPELIVTFLLTVVIMSSLSYFLLARPFQEPYQIGILLVSLSPSGIIMLVLSRFVPEINYDLIFSNFLFMTFGSIIYIPFVVQLFVGESIKLDGLGLFTRTAMLILCPFFASRILFKLPWSFVLDGLKKGSKPVLILLIYFIIAGSLSGITDSIIWESSLLGLSGVILSIYLIHSGLGYLIGCAIGDKSTRRTLAMISASRDTQIMIALALLYFPPLAVVPTKLSAFFHHTTNALWLWLFRD